MKVPGANSELERYTDSEVKTTLSTMLELSDPKTSKLPKDGVAKKELLGRLKKMIKEEEEHHGNLTARLNINYLLNIKYIF